MARRILLLITDLQIGGTPTVVRELAVRLREPGRVEVEVACLAPWGPVADQLRDAGVPVTALRARSVAAFPATLAKLVRLIRRGGFDTVFSFLVHANAVAAAASAFCPDVRFLQSIQTTQPDPRWHWRVQRVAHAACEAVVVPSESVAEKAASASRVPAAKLVVIPNAVDPDAFPRSPIPSADPRPYPIGFIGRLDPIKRVDLLLSELNGVNVGEDRVHLHIFGDGPERPKLEQIIRESAGLQRWVTMHGSVPRPHDVLPRIGLLVLRSMAEGFGLVLIEAMAAGVPVVATRVPGIRDVVRDKETGLLVHPYSAAEVMLAIRAVVEDTRLRRRLVENGLAEVRRRFSWSSVLPEYHKLLRLAPCGEGDVGSAAAP